MATNKKLGERLIEAGLITRDALTQALLLQARTPNARLGDCLLNLRLIGEQALLRFLATDFQTRYVSSEKLSKVKVVPEILDRVPVRFAEAKGLVPILFDKDRQALSVVMAEPQNARAIEELKALASLSDVLVFVGTRAAINAGIRKLYYGDPSAFEIAGPGQASSGLLLSPHDGAQLSRRLAASTGPDAGAEPRKERARGLEYESPPASARQAAEVALRSPLVSDNDYLQTLHVLVGLLETGRKDTFQAHSAAVARHSRTIAQRLGLEHRTVNHVTIAAYLHDLGKRPDRHFTLLSSVESSEWRLEAERYLKAPLQLLETAHLPAEVRSILTQVFETYDGSGFPQGVEGDAIPAGARVIAVVNAYEDLIKNSRSIYGRVFAKDEAMRRVRIWAGSLFDPAVVGLMEQIQSGELLRQRLLSDGRQVLVSHSDERTRSDLREALTHLGLTTYATGTGEGILSALQDGEADLYIAEVVPPMEEALAVVAPLRREPATVGLPVIFLAAQADPGLYDRVSTLHPAELISGAINAGQVAARAKELLDDRQASGAPGRVVSGLLDELSLPEVLQTISDAKRSGRLLVRSGAKQGEILIERGRVVQMTFGAATGESAFDAMAIELAAGELTLDPNFLILEQQMDKDVDILVREMAARLLAQAKVAPSPTG